MKQECTIDKIINVLDELQSQLSDAPSLAKKAIVDKNEAPGETPPAEEKKQSWWVRVRGRVKKIGKTKNEASSHASDSGGSQGGSSRRSRRNIGEDEADAELEILRLQSDIRQMKAAFQNLTQFQTRIITSLNHDFPSSKLRAILQKTDSIRSRSYDLKEIRRKIFNLKCEIPSLLYKQSSSGLSMTDSQTGDENGGINETGSDIFLPGLHVSEDFKHSLAFEEVVEKFQGLEFTQQRCLLSFAVFPENKEVKRTMLMYWWIGEGFIFCDDSENSVTRMLDEFSRQGLLEPVEDERKLRPTSYKMDPRVHSAVVYLAKLMDLFVLYSPKGKLRMKRSANEKVCLVRGSSLQHEAKTSVMKPKSLETVFNSSERYPDFTFKWFPEMVSLRVLYLGRWERTAKRHIEVESTEFLKNMKSLKNLRLASFQGISRIEKLENSICALPKLVILDLRACYNLEVLPDDIGSLENLIYLDVSECYMLDRMPKGVADLSRLQVLKGFVISQSDDEGNCAVKHLVNLRKLSITVNKFLFMVENLMGSLKGLERLESLKIAWGARFPDEDRRGEMVEESEETENSKEVTNEKENQRGLVPTEEKQEDLKEGEDEQLHERRGPFVFLLKGQTSQEKKEDGDGDGRNKKASLEEGKESNEEVAKSLKSDEVVEGEKKKSKSDEATETIQNKPDNQKGKGTVEGDGDKGKADLEEGKKQDEVEAEKSKSENGVDGVKKESPSRESTEMNQKKSDDQNKVEKEGNGDKGKADIEEGKKQDEADAEKSKSENGVKEVKESPSGESTDKIENKPDDKREVEKEGDGEKGKAGPVEGKKQDEVKAESSKSEYGAEGVKKAQDTIPNKPNDHHTGEKQEANGDGEKEKVKLEEGKKTDDIKAESSKPEKVIEGGEKTSPPKESKDVVKSKPDDKQRDDKQEDKGGKANLEEDERSKADKVIEGDEKTSPPQESKDTIQSKPGDHKEKRVEEKNKADLKKLDGGEEAQKSEKKNKLGKKVSFSEEPKAPIQKKPDDLKKEKNETASTSRPKKTAPKRKANLFMTKKNETKKRGEKWQEDSEIDTSKLPSSLKKLELECFPKKNPPIWLNPKNLGNLEKLSIRGGKLSRISDEPPTGEHNCRIQILRLKYLHEFKAEWKDLQALFPQMKLLEKYKCPKVAFCPTDGNGVWRSQP